jgi:hypothetical protein
VKRLAALAFALLCPIFGWTQYNSYTAFAAGTAPSYEGLWWNSSESGWGVSIAHQGDTLFAVWYTYDHDGSPMWLFMPDARLIGDDMDMMGMMEMDMMGMPRYSPMYSGSLYRSSMSGGKVAITEVGMATFLFKGRDSGVFAYTVGNVSQSKDISRMVFAAGGTECAVGGIKAGGTDNFQDLWWNPADSGWGVNIAHQGDTLFATYYTYDANGRGTWYVMSNEGRYNAGSDVTGFEGPMLQATGPAFDSPAWSASKVALTEVGRAKFLFDSRGPSQFVMQVGGVQQPAKPIARMAFSGPASVCH